MTDDVDGVIWWENLTKKVMKIHNCSRSQARELMKKEAIDLIVEECAKDDLPPFNNSCGIVRDKVTGAVAYLLRWRWKGNISAAIYVHEPRNPFTDEGLLLLEIFDDERERELKILKVFRALRAKKKYDEEREKEQPDSEGDVHVKEHWRRHPYTA